MLTVPYVQTPNLDFDRIASLRSALPIPLVLHGCSDIPPEQLQESVRLGMSKFNIATEYFRAAITVWYSMGIRRKERGHVPTDDGDFRKRYRFCTW